MEIILQEGILFKHLYNSAVHNTQISNRIYFIVKIIGKNEISVLDYLNLVFVLAISHHT